MPYEKLENCPACNHSLFKNEVICNDYFLSKESFNIVKCSNCGLLFTNPRPTETNIWKYYRSDNYISHNDDSKSLTNLIYKGARYFTLRSKLRLVKRNAKPKSLLDYGCGTGSFLKLCQERNIDIAGIEPDLIANQIATNRIGKTIESSLDTLHERKYDAITLWHVIEHVHDLNTTLTKLSKLLNKSGTMIVAVPNHTSWDSQKYGEHWAGWDVPRHLYHFSPNSMTALMKKHKLKITKILPMKLDSYYVSLLSEKYKNGKSSYLQAIINGSKSNRLAKKNNNYSSLIYIIKH